MNNKKTILQIIPSMISGGVERGAVEINDYLIKNGYDSIILSNGGNLTYKINKSGGKNIIMNVATKNPFKIFNNIKKIKQVIIDNKVDLVHVRSRAPAWSAYFACKQTKCPLVSTLHGNYSTNLFIFSFLKKIYNSIIIKADWIICVSNFIKDYAYENYELFKNKYFLGKVKIIPRGVDINIFDPNLISQTSIVNLITKLQLPSDKQIILLPGRLTEWKGQIYFLDVLSKLKNKDYICLIVGDSKGHTKYKKLLQKRIRELNLEDFIKIENNISDMTTCYSMANIVVSPSVKGEAFGRVVVEAQAMKKLVIATAIGGSLETIINEKTGWLIPVNKTKNFSKVIDVEKFAKALDMLLEMPIDERRKIGENAREHILENYTTQKMCQKTIELYEEVLKNSNKN